LPAAVDIAPTTNPAIPESRSSFRIAAVAATPTIKLARRPDAIIGAKHRCPKSPDARNEMALHVPVKTAHPKFHRAGQAALIQIKIAKSELTYSIAKQPL
jgi:hypothetical protein